MNKKGIANLMSGPQLEKDCFTVDYNTKRDWVATTPTGETIVFKKDRDYARACPIST